MKKITALTLALVLIFALCACGGSKSAAGTWKLTKITDGDQDYSEYAAMVQMSLVLNDDGTGYMEVAGEKDNVTWEGGSITIDGETEEFSVSGNELTIVEGTTEYVFTRK